MEDAKLRDLARDVAQQVADLANQGMQYRDPVWMRVSEWKTMTEEERSRLWNEETQQRVSDMQSVMSIYHTELQKNVAVVREEFQKRGLWEARGDMLYSHPTNPLGLQELAGTLNSLAAKV